MADKSKPADKVRPPTEAELAAFKKRCAQPGFPGNLEARLKKRQDIIDAKTKQAKEQLAAVAKAKKEQEDRNKKAAAAYKKALRAEIEKEMAEEKEAEAAKETPK